MTHTPGSANEFGGAIEIDDGTNARTEAPLPGPIGLDAPSGGGTSAAGIADRILGFARRQRGNRVGKGECFDLADSALSTAGAKSASDYGTVTRDADYVWGSSVSLTDLQPGDVVQMRDYRFDREVEVNNPDGSGSSDKDFGERPHHTAIVESVDGNGAVTVLEQNAPKGSAVRRSQLFFTDSDTTAGNRKTKIKVQGTFWFYRPQAK
jgi:CHAP domain-containing protein